MVVGSAFLGVFLVHGDGLAILEKRWIVEVLDEFCIVYGPYGDIYPCEMRYGSF